MTINFLLDSKNLSRVGLIFWEIEKVRLELTLENVASTWIKRQSQIEFIRAGSNPDSIIRLSGRPGYQIGKPIRLVDFDSELSSLSDGDVYEMEIMSHSSCSNAAIRSKTQFEKDQFVSCYMDFNMGGGDCSGTFLESIRATNSVLSDLNMIRLRVVQTEAIFFLKSMSERGG